MCALEAQVTALTISYPDALQLLVGHLLAVTKKIPAVAYPTSALIFLSINFLVLYLYMGYTIK